MKANQTKRNGKVLLGCSLAAVTLFSHGCNQPENDPELAPTGLTLVAMLPDGSVVDAVAVEESASCTIRFDLPPGQDELRVFTFGDRVYQGYDNKFYFTGRPDDDSWMGLGYVQASIQDGILMSIDSNGAGTLVVDEQTLEWVKTDLAEGSESSLTTIDPAQ
tara:strand:- start:8235 stop:8720 length:486 start_codon:yes stop_codon:yes gene_type:complete